MIHRFVSSTGLRAILLLVTSVCALCAQFVGTRDGQFVLGDRWHYYAGTNNYYLNFKPSAMVDDVLDSAAAMGLSVVRTWGFIDRGSLDGAVANADGEGHKDGVYFQYWNPLRGEPAYNDGADGLRMLDYAVYAAKRRGIRLIITLVNYWLHFGGMEQYRIWYGLGAREDFYTDARARQAYRNYAAHLAGRVNTLTGVAYRDEPAVFAWELANEPRNATTREDRTVIAAWVAEMSAHIKSIDPNHLVAVGDEGFINDPIPHNWDYPYQGPDGTDFATFLAVPAVDFGTFHMYPDDWGKTGNLEWCLQWIRDHAAIADALGKPVILEEFGWKDHATRAEAYRRIYETCESSGVDGTNFWMLAGRTMDGLRYQDYDGFTTYWGSPESAVIRAHAERMAQRNTLTGSAVRMSVLLPAHGFDDRRVKLVTLGARASVPPTRPWFTLSGRTGNASAVIWGRTAVSACPSVE